MMNAPGTWNSSPPSGPASSACIGTLPIRFSDYAIQPPNIAGFVSVDVRGTMELKLEFHRT